MKIRLSVILWIVICSISIISRADELGSAESDNVGILVFGDQGKGNAAQRIVANALRTFCERNRCHFSLLLGDNFYYSGVRSVSDPRFKTDFEDLYARLGIEFWAVLGNHDYGFGPLRGNIQAQIDYSNRSQSWRMPARYYTFESNGIQFIALDTIALPNDAAQNEWLEQQLLTPYSGFRIVYGHYPIHSGGEHGDNAYMRDVVLPKLCGKAHLYIAGHDHDLEYLKSDCEVSLVVSGAAAETRAVKPSGRSLFSASTLGFAYLSKQSATNIRIQYFDADLNRLAEFSIEK